MKIYSFIFRLFLQLDGKWSDAGTYEGSGIIGYRGVGVKVGGDIQMKNQDKFTRVWMGGCASVRAYEKGVVVWYTTGYA